MADTRHRNASTLNGSAGDQVEFGAVLLKLPLRIRAPRRLAEDLLSDLATLWSALPTSAPDPATAEQLLDFEPDGRLRASSYPAVDASPVQVALAEITSFLVARSPLLCVHAGVVSGRHGCIAIPGDSGHGKTTLVAALVRAGFGYLSDEVLAIDRDTGRLWRFPRPLSVDRRSWLALGLPAAQAPEEGREAMLQPAQLGLPGEPSQLTDIVLSRRTGQHCELRPAEPAAAVSQLLTNSFNHFTDGASSFQLAVDAARSARVWRLTYQEASSAAAELAERWL